VQGDHRGSLVPTAPQYGRFDDPGFGYGYGYGYSGYGPSGWNNNTYAAGYSAFASDAVAPSSYYQTPNTMSGYPMGGYSMNGYSNTMNGYGYPSMMGQQQQPVAPTYCTPQYQSMYSAPDYTGMAAMTRQQRAPSPYPSAAAPSPWSQATMTQQSMGAADRTASFDTFSLFQQRRPMMETVQRSYSQPMMRRGAASPFPVSMDALEIPDVRPNVWWTQQPEPQLMQPRPVPVWEQVPTAVAAPTPLRRASAAPATRYASASSVGLSQVSLSTIKSELRRGMGIMGTKTKNYLADALVPRGPLPVPVVRDWDGSRPRTYNYSPIDRTLYENGVPVCSVQYVDDGCAFNLVVDGVGHIGSLARPLSRVFTPSAFRNPLSVGPRRGEDWQVLDRNRQTRYRITRRARNYYDLHVTQGAHLGPLNRLLYVCNWYQAILEGQLSVMDERGAAAATCAIGADTTGSQMDRSITINCGAGADHLALITTVLLGLELARQYSNDAIHPSQQNNKGKASLGFGPSVVPHMLFL